MNNNILFKKGSYADFKEKILGIGANGVQGTPNIEEGALYLTTDEGGLYLGVKDANDKTSVQRIQGSVLYYDTLQQFTDKVAPPYSTDVIYFIASENALVRWDPTIKNPETEIQVGGWVQLNPTAPDYSGDITDLDTKIEAEKTRAKGAEAALDAKISQNTKKIGEHTAAIDTKADKTALEAEVTARDKLGDIVTENTQKITDLDTKIGKEADRAKDAEKELNTQIGENTKKIGQNTAAIATKANQADLKAEVAARSQLGDTVSQHTNSISNLGTQITEETERAGAAEQALSERITQNVAAIGENAAKIATKASQDDLNTEISAREQLGNTVTQHTSDITDLGTQITAEANRANDAEAALDAKITQNAAAISANTTKIATKANQADLNAEISAREQLGVTVTGHTESITNLGTQITEETDRAAAAEQALDQKIGENTKKIGEHTAAIDAKADKTALEAEVTARGKLGDIVSKHTTDITDLGTQISAEKTRAEAAEAALDKKIGENATKIGEHTAAIATKANQADLEAEVAARTQQANTFTTSINSINTNVSNLSTKVTNIESGLAGTGIDITDKTITLQNDLVANKKKITDLKDGEAASDAATVGQLNAAIAANDAMTFKGTLGTGGTTATLPTSANVGDTYKVCVEASYATGEKDDKGEAIKVAAKIGDLFINAAANDTDAPKWEHISSGYEARYAQHLGVDKGSDNYSAVITINDGVSAKANDITLASASKNIQLKVSGDTITATMVWGTF